MRQTGEEKLHPSLNLFLSFFIFVGVSGIRNDKNYNEIKCEAALRFMAL
jgi:hypothetical protein